MPATLSYPGVYVEEIPSGVHTIIGVSTSNTAFIGTALRGPVNTPIALNGMGDFDRVFGGIWKPSTLGYSMRDFFLNGGSVAYVVRVVVLPPDGAGVVSAKAATITVGSVPAKQISLLAASPGAWGNNLRVRVDQVDVKDPATEFNLTVRDNGTKVSPLRIEERFARVSMTDPARALGLVLKRSSLVTLATAPTQLPDAMVQPGDPSNDASGDPRTDPLGPDADPKYSAIATSVSGTDGVDPGGHLIRDADIVGNRDAKTGIYALLQLKTEIFNLLCVPPLDRATDVSVQTLATALAFCVERRAMLMVDSPRGWLTVDDAVIGMGNPPLAGDDAKNAAIFFPRLLQPDPKDDDRVAAFAACGTMAGIFARTDAQRGVWKAPAGIDASLSGTSDLGVDVDDPSAASLPITDLENGRLNPLGVNCLRSFPLIGRVSWGARTLRGADALASEWKYIPVRRTALYIEESLYRGLQWAVFEPNDEPLWSQIRLNVGAFMQGLFRQGAFQGQSPKDAYFVKCDSETTTQNDIDLGIVNIRVGFAPLKPAEFVVLKIQQIAGQIQV
jgi:uncharacterized protein